MMARRPARASRLPTLLDPKLFAASVLAVLVTPGPTNTLLATAGATAGFRRSLPLLAAELAGYLLSVSSLLLLLGPEIATRPWLATGLRLASAIILLAVASRLWSTPAAGGAPPVTPRHLFVTTVFNPKAIVFAFAIFPPIPRDAASTALPWLAGFSVLVVTVGAGWLGLGSLAGARATRAVETGLVRRLGATVVAGFGLLLVVSALWRG